MNSHSLVLTIQVFFVLEIFCIFWWHRVSLVESSEQAVQSTLTVNKVDKTKSLLVPIRFRRLPIETYRRNIHTYLLNHERKVVKICLKSFMYIYLKEIHSYASYIILSLQVLNVAKLLLALFNSQWVGAIIFVPLLQTF